MPRKKRTDEMEINMEHILISPGKLKLMLTKRDLDKYELDDVTLYGEDNLKRKAFRELLADVKKDVGFDAAEDKVLIQLYPSKDGGAEVYITRLGLRRFDLNEKKTNVVYTFPSMRELINGCAKLCGTGKIRRSSAWDGEGLYYLITEEENRGLDSVGGLSELCHEYRSPVMEAYVREHFHCFLDDGAVESIGEFI